jgi:hypothetical protein
MFARNLNGGRLGLSLDLLRSHGLARMEMPGSGEKGGRPAEIWFAANATGASDMIRGLEADKPGLIENRGLVVSGVSVVYDNGKKGASEGWRCRPEVPKNSLAVNDQNDKYDQSPRT